MHYRLVSRNEQKEIIKSTEAGDDFMAAVSQGAHLRHELNAAYQVDLISVTHDGEEHKLVQLGGFA